MSRVKRGEVYYADLSPTIGSEQGGTRPVVVIQNDVGNKFSPTVIVAAITSQKHKTRLPTHVMLSCDFLPRASVVLVEQVRTIDKRRLLSKEGILSEEIMNEINKAIIISFGLECN